MMKKIVKLIIGLGIIAGIWWLVRCQCINLSALTPAAIRDYIQSFGGMGPVIYVIAYILNTISLIPPIGILSLSAGLAFGEAQGFILIMIAATVGSSLTFLISRYFGRGLIEKTLKVGIIKRLDDALGENGFLVILFFRVVPIPPFLYETLNYASGLTKIKFKDYFFATVLGIIPGSVVSAFLGGSLGSIKTPGDLLSGKLIGAVGLYALILGVPSIYQIIKKKRLKDKERR